MRQRYLGIAITAWIAAAFLALVILGCAPTWRPPRGVTNQQWAADQYECKAKASAFGRLDTGHLSGPIGGPPGFGTGFAQGVAIRSVLDAAREREDLYDLCLEAKGYVRD